VGKFNPHSSHFIPEYFSPNRHLSIKLGATGNLYFGEIQLAIKIAATVLHFLLIHSRLLCNFIKK